MRLEVGSYIIWQKYEDGNLGSLPQFLVLLFNNL